MTTQVRQFNEIRAELGLPPDQPTTLLTFPLDELGACLKPGRLLELKEVQFTRAAYGPVLLWWCWAIGHAEPLYLVSNRSSAEEAIVYYQKRFRIETFFQIRKVGIQYS
jgi:hypothetical protein